MVLTVGSTKGGVGKTTLAINIVIGLVRGRQDVLLIDGDEQAHAIAFTELRSTQLDGEPGYTAVALHGQAIRTQVRQLRSRYDQIVIDVGGRDTVALRSALAVSDVVLIPAAPRSFDLWGADSTAALVREARELLNPDLKAFAILSGADSRGTDNNEALTALGELEGIDARDVRIVRRKAYPDAAGRGLGVLEHNDPKAIEDFHRLFTLLYPSLERKIA